ncbi:MAG: Arc family DNA binding domain-containing protein [bacterium]|nr:Arc family DNA binding domain-containing protein [bacterium]
MVDKEKKPFALRLNKETMEAIEKWASDEFRSTNGQLEWMLTKALKDAGRLKQKKN